MYEPEERGTGKALCRICGQPCRDHAIGPCPMMGVSTIHGAFSSGPTDRTLWRHGEKPPPHPGIPQVTIRDLR
jgi:hypothetical protein